MPDPIDPALTVHKSPSPNSSAPAHPDETSGAANRSNSSGVVFGPSAAAGEVGTLGPYRVLKELGKGGMGAVYLAIDTRLDRKLALKVMLPEFAANRDAKERFLREAKAAAQVTHDNVVTVYEADERDGVPYITMQLLQGYPLDEFLTKKGTPSLRHVIRIARETALGLAAAHKHGLVHRDIKPANLWLEAPNGRVKVLDFGLAKPIGTDTELTRSGAVVGTPAFMSPEQGRGLKVDHRTDLFSLGAVLYRLCTGRTPFEGPNVLAVLMALARRTRSRSAS
jgi:serine/threonine protein kinase